MTTSRMLPKSVAVVVLLTLAAAASATPDRPIRAVPAFSILGDMVSRIGGEHVAVTTLVGSNGDMHVYRPTPSGARAVSEAHVLVVNGLDFEGWLDRLIEAATGGKLYPGALSDRDGPAPTHVDLMRHNARTLAQAPLR